jgi:branched-chain amino acid transport system substrate-binding protein
MLRRTFIGTLLGAAAAISFTASAQAQTIKIGVINSYSGFLAQAGDEMQKGIDLFIKENEKSLPAGVKIELVKRDDGANPETGKRVAQELITRDRVNLLFGIVASPVGAAVAPLTAEAKVPLVITNAAGAGITRISPYVVRTSFTLWQQGLPMGQWAAKQGWKTAITAVSDFIPGHDVEGAFTKGFTDGGGRVVSQLRFPPANPDFAPFVQRIKDAKPDAAFLWVPAGAQATGMLKAVRDLGLRDVGTKIISTQDLAPDEELPNIGEMGNGMITAGTYSIYGDRPANKAFLAAWDKEYGNKAIPDFLSAHGWDGMAMVFDMIKATNGKFTGDDAMKFFSNWKTDKSPRGVISIDPKERDIVQDIYIRRHDWKDGKLVTVEFDSIKAVKDPWKELNPAK